MNIMNFVVSLLGLGFACVACHPKSLQNSLLPMVSEKEELTARHITPLPKNLKNNVVEGMTRDEITSILGAEHEAFGSGVSYLVWYFDDHTCLTLTPFETVGGIWFPCEPGGWTFDMLKWTLGDRPLAGDKEEKVDSP